MGWMNRYGLIGNKSVHEMGKFTESKLMYVRKEWQYSE